jgi:tRNA(Ser,Leu) C12 N-acetylase TAN1
MAVLVVTCGSGSGEAAAIEAMDALLPEDRDARVEMTRHEGVLVVRTSLDPLLARSLLFSSLPRRISRVVPIEQECKPDFGSIADAALTVARRMSGHSFVVRCKTRGSVLNSDDLEVTVGQHLCQKTGMAVNLKSPDFVVYVEVVDDFAGVAALPFSLPISMESVREDIISSMRYISKGGV